MITTTYTCDRCGNSQTERTQLWEIEVNIRALDGPRFSTISGFDTKLKALWCRKCTEGYSFLHGSHAEPPVIEGPKLEDLLREIIREEIQEAQS